MPARASSLTPDQLEAVLGAVSDAVVTADTEGRITGWLGGAEALFGWSADEALGRPLTDLIPPGTRPAHDLRYAEVALGAPSKLIGSGPVEVDALRADGTTVPVELTLGRGEGAEGPFLVGVLRDVTSRRQADARLRVAQDRFTSAFEHAPVGMTMTTPDGRYIRVNSAFCRLVGLGHLELDDLEWSLFTDERDAPAERAARARLLAGETTAEHFDKRLLDREGRRVWVQSHLVLVRDGDGAPLHFLSQLRDVDAERRALSELERSNRELEDLAAVASHDLRVPLSTVSGLLELLRRRQGPRLDREGLELVVHAADAVGRMQGLIESLLRLARVGGDGDVRREPVDLGVLARDVLAGIEGSDAVEVGGLPVVHGDPGLLSQVLQNLVANALRHADRSAPVVRLGAQRQEAAWCVSVADNGAGVPEADRGRVFERFARGDRPGSAGLGLAICRRATERQGGRIWIEEAPGGGADVRFTVPDPPAAA